MAAFAAIMLLASTQVELPEQVDDSGSNSLTLVSEVTPDFADQTPTDADEFDGAAQQLSTPAVSPRRKKSKGLSLDLLQFRR